MNAGIFSCWFEITQLNALSFYRVDVVTNQIGKISAIVGYLDGSQLFRKLKSIIPFLNIGIFVLELAMIGMMCACCFIFRFIIASQPSGLSFLRDFIQVKQRMQYIWIANINVSSFDCFKDLDGLSYWRADNTVICLNNNIFQIVSAVIAIINLIIFFSKSFVLNTVIYNHNPKNGGLLSNP
ncbi:MAG: hypothetical protein EZS28_029711 [Streblomastix strix]|uniref:Uncharacterized protein n=1 Tax=Streblomastix strix TaxID=222440 RepID=A0A5J4UXE7_9EUKA|nr:MAG: hypothetical protein EZS28_029711 [Streblomastix strix]